MGEGIDLGIPHLVDATIIGRGGFAVVYAATDPRFERRVAVKLFGQMLDEAERRRFDRECRISGRLSSHPNVVMVHDAGFTPGDRAYLVMELLEGGSLADLLARQGPLGWAEAIDHLLPVCDALGAAHNQSILHRDVKPENILLADDGSPRLTDFGIASLMDATGATSTNITASWLHTPPETFSNQRDERSDLYSLASTLYTLAIGHAPFWRPDDQSLHPLIGRLLNEPPPHLPDGMPAALDAFLQSGLAKDPAQRPQTATAFAARLSQVRSAPTQTETAPMSAPPAPPPAPPSGFTPPAPAPPALASTPTPPLSGPSAQPLSPPTQHPVTGAGSVQGTSVPAGRRRLEPGQVQPRVRLAITLALVIAVAAGAVALAYSQQGDEAGPDGTGDEIVGSSDEATGDVPDGPAVGGLTSTEVMVLVDGRNPEEAEAIEAALARFEDQTGVTVTYEAAAEPELQLDALLAAGSPPDIAMAPIAPRDSDRYARDGLLHPLPDEVATAVARSWPGDWLVGGSVDGTAFGVPVDAGPKSLVWYQPSRFDALGYEVPATWNELVAFTDAAATVGSPPPWCVGLESDVATGWIFTDWVEDVVLRFHGPEVYDQWASGTLGFSDDRIVAAFEEVGNLWGIEGSVLGGSDGITITNWFDSGPALAAGECLMHRQGAFFAGIFPPETPLADGTEGAIEVFNLPSVDGGSPVVTYGTYAFAFADRPEVWAVMEYLGSAGFMNARQAARIEQAEGGVPSSGVLSAVEGLDLSRFTPIEQSMIEVMTTADVVRFDASDHMPVEVSETFWSEGIAFVDGNRTAAEAAAVIEAAWSSSSS